MATKTLHIKQILINALHFIYRTPSQKVQFPRKQCWEKAISQL